MSCLGLAEVGKYPFGWRCEAGVLAVQNLRVDWVRRHWFMGWILVIGGEGWDILCIQLNNTTLDAGGRLGTTGG